MMSRYCATGASHFYAHIKRFYDKNTRHKALLIVVFYHFQADNMNSPFSVACFVLPGFIGR